MSARKTRGANSLRNHSVSHSQSLMAHCANRGLKVWESAVAIRRERGVSEFSGRGFNYSRLVFLALGWSAQTCSVNSLSRINSKLRIISSKDAPVGAPEGLNRQPHSEQPKPRKRSCSIHTSFRLMAASVAAPHRVPACCQGTKRSGTSLTTSFPAAYWPICNRKPSPSLGVAEDPRIRTSEV